MKLNFIGWLTPRWRILFDNLPDSFNGDTIVDVGCGQGVLGFLLAHNYPNDNYILNGFDGYLPYIKIIEKMGIYDSVKCIKLEYLVNEVADYTFCLDVLEHNDKDISQLILDRMIVNTRKKVYVTVPNEEPLQNPKRRERWKRWREESDNKYKGHVSSWSANDFPGDVYVFDNRKGLTKTMRAFDTVRRKVFRVDWNESHILAVIDGAHI